MEQPQTQTAEKFDSWAIVELMGHRKLAGRVSEQVIAGTALLRIDVPAYGENGNQEPGFTQFYGASSIYCLTPTTEEICKRFAARYRERPVSAYELPQLAPVRDIDADEPDGPDDNEES